MVNKSESWLLFSQVESKILLLCIHVLNMYWTWISDDINMASAVRWAMATDEDSWNHREFPDNMIINYLAYFIS